MESPNVEHVYAVHLYLRPNLVIRNHLFKNTEGTNAKYHFVFVGFETL